MGARKIVDEQEVLRWFEEGWTYGEMSDYYREHYNIETSETLWANFRRRRGLEARIVRDSELIPWEVQPQHRWNYAIMMLRAEARRRAGKHLTDADMERLLGWLRTRREHDDVVDYDPTTREGFSYVPRRPGVDKDLIHEPGRERFKRKLGSVSV